MKLQHALGGLENLGPVNLEKRPFVQEWEKRIFGIHTVMMAESAHLSGALPKYAVNTLPTTFKETWTWASLRAGAESMQPFEYFKYRYYEKWLMGICQFFVDKGYVTQEELTRESNSFQTNPEAPLPNRPNKAIRQQILDYLTLGDSGLRPTTIGTAFSEGESVVVADPPAVDHTRLPGYLRNKKGMVTKVYPGAYNYFVSTGLDGIGDPMPVYQVAFKASDIWSESLSEPNTTIHADLYQAYLRHGVA